MRNSFNYSGFCATITTKRKVDRKTLESSQESSLDSTTHSADRRCPPYMLDATPTVRNQKTS